jgi:hypothetical protein
VTDLSHVVSSMGTSYTLTRSPKATYVNGRLQPGGAPTESTIRAVVAPISGRELERLPEGMDTRELLQAFTVERLYTNSELYEPDVLTVADEDYEVQQVEDWSPHGNFFRSIMTKVG